MRHDMKRVIIDPGRDGGGSHVKRPQMDAIGDDLEGYDSGPRKGKMSYVQHAGHYGQKMQTDLISPLRRFLRSRVGQNWDKVWSEVCEHADYRSIDGNHLRDHVGMEITFAERDVGMGRWRRFYVDNNNCLQENKESLKRLYRQPEQKQTVFKVDSKYLHQHKGIWYEVEMVEVPFDTRYGYRRIISDEWSGADAFDTANSFWGDRKPYSYYSLQDKFRDKYGNSPIGSLWYAKSKKSANKKQIKKLKATKEFKKAA